MAEISSLKRQREEKEDENFSTQVVEKEEEIFKRQKSYKDIITLLEEEEDVPNEDLSLLISTLQEEISCSSSSSPSSSSAGPDPVHDLTQVIPYGSDPENPPSNGSGSGSGEEEEKESVMRHLLEASDDELGLPNTNNLMDGFDDVVGGGEQIDGGDFFLPEGLWEFEDHEAANYYSMLQLQQCSEIFL